MATKRGPIEFTVKGRGRFPLDMLRYDRCFPKGSNDVVAIGETMHTPHSDEPRVVNLISFRDTGYAREPTVGRWESFGWRVSQ